MDQHLRFGDLFTVIGVVFPFVSVVVAAPSISIVLRKVRAHVPKRCLVVVKVVVQIKQTWINRAVGFEHRHVGQLNVGRYIVFPNRFNHAVFDQDMAFIDDISLAGHGYDTSLQHVGAGVNIVVESIATNHVLSHAVDEGVVAPPRCPTTNLLPGKRACQ